MVYIPVSKFCIWCSLYTKPCGEGTFWSERQVVVDGNNIVVVRAGKNLGFLEKVFFRFLGF